MKLHSHSRFVVLGALLLGVSGPAFADDWQSICTFDSANFAFLVNYHAEGPNYDIQITSSGTTEFGRGQKISMSVIQTPADTILFSKSDDAIQILLRVTKDNRSIATVEIGSGGSWDHQKLVGKCDAR